MLTKLQWTCCKEDSRQLLPHREKVFFTKNALYTKQIYDISDKALGQINNIENELNTTRGPSSMGLYSHTHTRNVYSSNFRYRLLRLVLCKNTTNEPKSFLRLNSLIAVATSVTVFKASFKSIFTGPSSNWF